MTIADFTKMQIVKNTLQGLIAPLKDQGFTVAILDIENIIKDIDIKCSDFND